MAETERQEEIMYAWFDENDLPRAYGAGPVASETFVREVASDMLDQYIEKKNGIGYGLTREMFTLKKVTIGTEDWEIVAVLDPHETEFEDFSETED